MKRKRNWVRLSAGHCRNAHEMYLQLRDMLDRAFEHLIALTNASPLRPDSPDPEQLIDDLASVMIQVDELRWGRLTSGSKKETKARMRKCIKERRKWDALSIELQDRAERN